MAFNIVVKFLATYICITTVTAWDPPHETDQIKGLSNQIANLKSLLNHPDTPSHKYNYGPPVPWDNNNRDSDYERYLKQQYLLPIINSVSDISEHLVKIINDQAHQQNSNEPYPVNYPPRPNFGDISDRFPPFNGPLGGGSDSTGGSGYSGSTFSSDSSPFSGSGSFKPANGFGVATSGGFQNQIGGGSSYSSGGSSYSSGGSSYSSGSKPFSINSRPFDHSFRPLPSESHGFSSGDSSGRPVIPSRFPSISNRQPDDDYDPNQNWGFATEDKDDRPTTLKTTPKPPQVCNCEEQNKNITSLALKLKLKTAETKPAACKAVILLCCVPGNSEEQRRACFMEQGCPKTYSTGISCLHIVIQAVFKDVYGDS